MEETIWFGDTILRLDKILAIEHNTGSDLKAKGTAYVTLDNAAGTRIEVEFMDWEHATDSVQQLKDRLEEYLYEKAKFK